LRIGIRDLIGKVHLRWGRDIFASLGLFLLVFPILMGGDPQRNLYLLGVRSLEAVRRLDTNTTRLPFASNSPRAAALASFTGSWRERGVTYQIRTLGRDVEQFHIVSFFGWFAAA
jgi:hypothetical protein